MTIVFFFSHRISPGIWKTNVLGYYKDKGYTIRDAIHYWYHNVSDEEEGVVFSDKCSGPHCSHSYPDKIVLQEVSSAASTWSAGSKITITVVVLLISMASIMLKVCVMHNMNMTHSYAVPSLPLILQLYCVLWLKQLQWKQWKFVNESHTFKTKVRAS